MAEDDTRWHAIKGPILDSLAGRKKLYEMLAYFLASRAISDLCDDGDNCSFRAMLDDFEESSLTQLLIENAVSLRIKDDLFLQQHGVSAETQKCVVGTLESNGLTDPLSFREACNKIVHANHLNFDVERREDVYCRYLTPVVYLYGTRNNCKWKATLDVIKWIKQAAAMLP